jgi:pimeloyl-ACP methyl ester carboxylesterase
VIRTRIPGHGGQSLSVLSAGDPSAPAILLIHGWSQAALSFTRQLGGLADRFHVVAPDLRGHGASDKPDAAEAYGQEAWAGDIAAVIEGMGLDRPVILGWSMGGYVVQDYLTLHGDSAVSGVVLCSTGVTKGSFLPEAAKAFRAADPGTTAAGMLSEDTAENIAATLGFIRACTNQPMEREDYATAAAFNMLCPPHIRAVSRQRPADYRAVMAALTVPVLVVWGDAERVIHRSQFDEALATMPFAQASVFEGCGHMPFWEAPERFNAELAAFADACFEARAA